MYVGIAQFEQKKKKSEKILSGEIVFDFSYFDWGSDYYLKNNMMMPENALDVLANFDSILLGAVGHPKVPDHITLNGLLLPIRRKFDQYVSVRPCYLWENTDSVLKNALDLDFVIIVSVNRLIFYLNWNSTI